MQLLPISVPTPKHTPTTASTDTYSDAGLDLGFSKLQVQQLLLNELLHDCLLFCLVLQRYGLRVSKK